jgi:uncharacterized membrane protein YdjX (TVP38/TMEM64 family)
MMTQRTWLWIGGGVLAVAAALTLGVPLASVLVLAAALACPLAMYFGMRGMGMGQGCRHDGMHEHTADGVPEKGARVRQGEPDRR